MRYELLLLALSYLSIDLLSLEQLWAPQPVKAFASKPLDTGGKVVAPVQASSWSWMFQKDTLFCRAVSLAQALIWERMNLAAELKLSPCFVYVRVLSRTLSAFEVEVPCQELQFFTLVVQPTHLPLSMIPLSWRESSVS